MFFGHSSHALFLVCAAVLPGALGCTAPPPLIEHIPLSPDVFVSVRASAAGRALCLHERGRAACDTRLFVGSTPSGAVDFARGETRSQASWDLGPGAPAVVLAVIAATADGFYEAECPDADCPLDAPRRESPVDFAAFGSGAAAAYFAATAPLAHPLEVAACGSMTRYEGDHVCTGWANFALRLDGMHDLSHCCQGHDACFYECPLDEGAENECRGTPCINTCNRALEGCCYDAGGGPVNCSTFAVATDLVGGAGRNGCGKDKATLSCEASDFTSCGDTDRCVCETCNDITGGQADCGACACTDECDPELDAPYCMHDGRGHFRLRCEQAPYADCYKWTESACPPGDSCHAEVNEGGAVELSCAVQTCPYAPECDESGALLPGCYADDGGAYFTRCLIDPFGCAVVERVYCIAEDGSSAACLVSDDDVPGCEPVGADD